jgi:hypothetical protein
MWIFPSFGGFLFDLIKDGGGLNVSSLLHIYV